MVVNKIEQKKQEFGANDEPNAAKINANRNGFIAFVALRLLLPRQKTRMRLSWRLALCRNMHSRIRNDITLRLYNENDNAYSTIKMRTSITSAVVVVVVVVVDRTWRALLLMEYFHSNHLHFWAT